jgi:ABC-type nitrate/sulfonate/bicarbonate transport system substrate-binding protein
VISFQGEPERIAALINGDIQGASLSIPHASTAINAGLKVLLRTGDYIPRAGGTIWGMQAYVDKNPETAKKLIRAIAKAVMYFRDNKEGSIPVLKHHLGIKTDARPRSSGTNCMTHLEPRSPRICSTRFSSRVG